MRNSPSDFLPVYEPWLDQRDVHAVASTVEEGWVSSSGSAIEEFETAWSGRCGRAHGIAVANGTVALQLATAILRLPPGSEILMPTFTIISCALALIYNRCTPVLVDSDPETWCMDVESAADLVTRRTRAVMPVHIYGHPVDMSGIRALAQAHDLCVIEDAAEAHGAEFFDAELEAWFPCGSFGEVSAFSFYANKAITTGEGGMILTDDSEVAERARTARNLGFGKIDRFRHSEIAFNFRLTNMQAALGLSQLRRFDTILDKKRWIASEYRARLQSVEGVQLQAERAWARSGNWMFALLVSEDTGMDARSVQQLLRDRGIDTRPFFVGMHEQEVLKPYLSDETRQFPVAERIARQGLYLPSGLTLGEKEINRVSEALVEILSHG